MPISNYTPENLSESISRAEQLSLALLMLFDQQLDEQQLRAHIHPLLSQLNCDLQDISFAHRYLQAQGGMGDAPMVSALAPCPA